MSAARLYSIGVMWSILWILAVGGYGLHRAAEGPRRFSMLCYRMQAQAKANPGCADPGSALRQPMCRFADANCQAAIDPAALAGVVAAALLPPMLAWAIVLVRRRKRRPCA